MAESRTAESIAAIAPNDIVLKVDGKEGADLYVVRFDDETPGALPKLGVLDKESADHEALMSDFEAGMLMGVPTGGDAAKDGVFRFDPQKARGNVDAWAAKRERQTEAPNDGEGDAGKYDVLFSRPEGGAIPAVYNIRFTEKAGEPIVPFKTARVEDAAALESIVSVFRSGTYLAFLDQLGAPTGFTCTLLNTERFWRR
jgi:hypothetical protein